MSDEETRSPYVPVAVLMVAFCLLTWGVWAVHSTLGTVVLGWVVVVGAAAASGFFLQDLAVPRPLLVGLLATVVAAWLTLSWYVALWAAGGDLGVVGSLIGSLVAAQVGGALGAWLAVLPRPKPPAPLTPVVLLAIVPPLVVWLAWGQGDRPEIDAAADELEATGVAPYLLGAEGFELRSVEPETALDSTYGVPGIRFWFDVDRSGSATTVSVLVMDEAAEACRDAPGCSDGSFPEHVDLDDAVAVVATSSSDELSADEHDRLVDGLADAPLATYTELAQHHG